MNALTYWKMERDADGVAWLALDKPGTSANVLSSEVLIELGALGHINGDSNLADWPEGLRLLKAFMAGCRLTFTDKQGRQEVLF